MKRLNKPNIDSAEVYAACIAGISDAGLANKFHGAREQVLLYFRHCEVLAETHLLFSLPASTWGDNAQMVLAGVTKGEFVDLYKNYMANRSKPARKYYDKIIMTAPLGKCPLCGFGQASTLDHFLSKSRYPAFSVLCSNLIPSCTDCNKGKGSPVVTHESQILHPYFETSVVEQEPWLYAEVIESAPTTVRYFVFPPASWPEDLARRTANYLDQLDLARRFSIEAASEVAGLSTQLHELGADELRRDHLSEIARIERRERTNSWKAALYEALANSNWFLRGGYRNPQH